MSPLQQQKEIIDIFQRRYATKKFNQEKVEHYLAQAGWINPEEFGVSLMISFGYREENIKPKSRQNLEEIYEVI